LDIRPDAGIQQALELPGANIATQASISLLAWVVAEAEPVRLEYLCLKPVLVIVGHWV
jgi:hypothetical protein